MKFQGASLIALAAALLCAWSAAAADVTTAPHSDATAKATLDISWNNLARIRNKEALRHFSTKDYPAALSALQEAYELNDSDPEINNNLAYLYDQLGNFEQAEYFYQETLRLDPERYVAYINLVDLLMERELPEERLAEAAGLLVRARELKGNKPTVILRQARVAARRGLYQEARHFYREYSFMVELSDEKLLEIGDFYRNFGKQDEALERYRKVSDEGEFGRQAAQRIWQIEVERQARQFGWVTGREAIPSTARILATRGRIEYGKGNLREAERLLSEALALAPHFSEARMNLGDVLRDAGHADLAELAYLRALAVDHGNAELHARLGELYLTGKGKTTNASQAAFFLSHALQLKPEWTSLRLKLARAYQGSGSLAAAMREVERVLAQTTVEEERAQALAMKEALREPLAVLSIPTHEPDLEPTDGGEVGQELIKTLSRVRALMARGEPDGAMAILEGIPRSQRTPEVLNLEGRILYAVGRGEEALEVLNASLEKRPGQAAVHELLGNIHLSRGEDAPARRHLVKARKLGLAAPLYHLARLELGEEPEFAVWAHDLVNLGSLTEARSLLDRYLASEGARMHEPEAQVLRRRVGERLVAVAVALAVPLVVLLLAVVLLWRRSRGGVDLETLVRNHPESGPEVQRVLSAIRHEVLKHNTMVLSGLVAAVKRGEDPSEKAARLHMALFGSSEEEAVLQKLLAYKEQLEQIGRTHGVRLNLQRRDAALSALLNGFNLLKKADPLMYRAEILTPPERARLLKMLKQAARLLNVEGYEAVRSLLDRLRVLAVDRELLEGTFRNVRREPAFGGVEIAPLEFDADLELPVGVPVPRQAFEDIITNLLRNALDSSRQHTEGEIRIGLDLKEEIDMITGFEKVALHVKDRSPQALTTEMIRGRFIEGGLGLAADLVSKYEGAIEAMALTGEWAKAVVVRFPRAELPDAEGDDS